VIKAAGADTGDKFFVSETTIAPGFAGPPPHHHERLHDMFYVLEGTLTMTLGDQQHTVTAGGFVCVPPGVTHTFSNPGSTPVRFFELQHASRLGALHARARPGGQARTTQHR
jgi:mannose-6-phosphate isomerase-like protein (cupin superfamily)